VIRVVKIVLIMVVSLWSVEVDDDFTKEYKKFKNPNKMYNQLNQNEAIKVYSRLKSKEFKQQYEMYIKNNKIDNEFKENIEQYMPKFTWIGTGLGLGGTYYYSNSDLPFDTQRQIWGIDGEYYIRLFSLRISVDYTISNSTITDGLWYGLGYDFFKFKHGHFIGASVISNYDGIKIQLYYIKDFKNSAEIIVRSGIGNYGIINSFLIGYKLW